MKKIELAPGVEIYISGDSNEELAKMLETAAKTLLGEEISLDDLEPMPVTKELLVKNEATLVLKYVTTKQGVYSIIAYNPVELGDAIPKELIATDFKNMAKLIQDFADTRRKANKDPENVGEEAITDSNVKCCFIMLTCTKIDTCVTALATNGAGLCRPWDAKAAKYVDFSKLINIPPSEVNEIMNSATERMLEDAVKNGTTEDLF